MHGTYDQPKRPSKKTGGDRPVMAAKAIPKPPPTPKGTENGKKPGKAFPHK